MIVDILNAEIEELTKVMTVQDLKGILKDLDDDIPIVIPSTERFDPNRIIGGLLFVKTAGLLRNDSEEKPVVLCLNSARHGWDISTQIKENYVPSTYCEEVLF